MSFFSVFPHVPWDLQPVTLFVFLLFFFGSSQLQIGTCALRLTIRPCGAHPVERCHFSPFFLLFPAPSIFGKKNLPQVPLPLGVFTAAYPLRPSPFSPSQHPFSLLLPGASNSRPREVPTLCGSSAFPPQRWMLPVPVSPPPPFFFSFTRSTP